MGFVVGFALNGGGDLTQIIKKVLLRGLVGGCKGDYFKIPSYPLKSFIFELSFFLSFLLIQFQIKKTNDLIQI
ncbi:hypothetical protein EC525_04130 [Helicobacter pylori]|nr:hypothetical protein EC525_04130 [Helicobacter pylori]